MTAKILITQNWSVVTGWDLFRGSLPQTSLMKYHLSGPRLLNWSGRFQLFQHWTLTNCDQPVCDFWCFTAHLCHTLHHSCHLYLSFLHNFEVYSLFYSFLYKLEKKNHIHLIIVVIINILFLASQAIICHS